jgi:predicted amidohydrolase YtcJ
MRLGCEGDDERLDYADAMPQDTAPPLTRRTLLKHAAAGAAGMTGGVFSNLFALSAQGTPPRVTADLLLTNAKFVDGRGIVGAAMAVRNGRILAVGDAGALGPADRTLDLGGRTVVPGLFDGHVHYTRTGLNPGYEARRIERAFSIAELQEAIARRASSVPAGGLITCIGGWNHSQLVENRRPTQAELDAAAPRHPVYISATGGGTGAITNSLGRVFLAGKGVTVDEATGVVASPQNALAALQAAQTIDDKLRGTADLNAHANSLGLTGVINAGNFEDQELPLRLWREDRLTIRMRPLFPADSPDQVDARARNNFSQSGRAVGDDLYRVAGFGERIGGNDTMSPQLEPTARAVARHGWLLQQHSITIKENDFHLGLFRSIGREYPIDRLRWSIIHLQSIDEERLTIVKELGVGASAQTWTYLSTAGGPPFRRIVDAGVHAGVGTDSTNVSALDPWLSLFYMTSGRNAAGMLTNDGQQISRLEALRLYTEGAAWFSFDEHHLGSFAAGKYADLAVLSHDYLTVPDQTIRRIESVLTLVAGRIVHAANPFTR